MSDERVIDEHLVAVLDQVLDAVYQSKQAAWATTDGVRDADEAPMLLELAAGINQRIEDLGSA